ncbi:MAG: branched-chain amino acid transporter substrate-binding protein [Marmoricola sp.]|jgi:branched-chain amino acid transport system substrate-binding protein|nr:branched-chain amino acid transporter substrate-binding protein [Marmoricola sp.]
MRTRPLAKLAAIGLVGALALTGCGSSDKKSDGGLSNSGGSKSSDSYTIAFQGPLSGDNQQLGINEVNGAQLAIDQANKSGDLGFKLKLLKADDIGDQSKAPAAAAQVLQDSTVVGVIGPAFSGPTKAVAKTYGDANMGLISPSATNPDLTSQGFTTFHRVVPADNIEGVQAADWLAKKAKKVFVIDDLSEYGKGAADVVRAQLKKDNIAVVSEGVDQKTDDYGPIATQVAQSGAQAMFYGGYDAQAGKLAKALKSANFTGIAMGGNGVKSSVFEKGAGAAGDGWYFSCGCLDAVTAPGAKDFTTAYKTAFNADPSTYSPEAYDATNAMIEAIKTAKKDGSVTRESVAKAITGLDYKGITTTIKFQANGELEEASQVINLFKQAGGKISVVGDIREQN